MRTSLPSKKTSATCESRVSILTKATVNHLGPVSHKKVGPGRYKDRLGDVEALEGKSEAE